MRQILASIALASMALGCVLFALALTGCLRRRPEEIIRLTWWITFAPDSDEYTALQTIAESYTEQTGHLIELVSVPWDDIAPRGAMATRLALALESRRGPDVWGPVPHTWIGPYVARGQALALDTKQVRDSGQYLDIAMYACRVDGTQYAVPILMDSIAMIHNKALVPDPPESFEELVEVAKGLTDVENDRWGLVLPLMSQYHVYPFIDGYGGYVFKCEEERCDPSDIGLNNQGAVQGVEFLSNLYLEEKLFPEPLSDRAVMHSYALRLFTEGRAGVLLDGSWVLPEVRASRVNYGVAPIPRLPEAPQDPRPLTIVYAVSASALTAYPDEALDFLNFLAAPESVVAMHDVLGKAPVRQDVLRLPALRQDRELRTWRDQAANGVPLPNVAELDYVWAPWARALDEAIPGLRPAQDALDQAVEQIRSYVEGD